MYKPFTKSKKENSNPVLEFDLIRKPKDKNAEIIKERSLAYAQQIRSKSLNKLTTTSFDQFEVINQIDLLYEMMIRGQPEWKLSFKLVLCDKVKSIGNRPFFGLVECKELTKRGKFWCLWINYKREDLEKEQFNSLLSHSLNEVREEKEMEFVYSLFSEELTKLADQKADFSAVETKASDVVEKNDNFAKFYKKMVKPVEEALKENVKKRENCNESLYSVEREFILSPRRQPLEMCRTSMFNCENNIEKEEFECQTDAIWNNLTEDFNSAVQFFGKKRAFNSVVQVQDFCVDGQTYKFKQLEHQGTENLMVPGKERDELVVTTQSLVEIQAKVKEFILEMSREFSVEFEKKERKMEVQQGISFEVAGIIREEMSILEEINDEIEEEMEELHFEEERKGMFTSLMMEREETFGFLHKKERKVYYMNIFDDKYAFVKEDDDVKVFEKRRRR